jgi:hypothetical protein
MTDKKFKIDPGLFNYLHTKGVKGYVLDTSVFRGNVFIEIEHFRYESNSYESNNFNRETYIATVAGTPYRVGDSFAALDVWVDREITYGSDFLEHTEIVADSINDWADGRIVDNDWNDIPNAKIRGVDISVLLADVSKSLINHADTPDDTTTVMQVAAMALVADLANNNVVNALQQLNYLAALKQDYERELSRLIG